MKRYKKINQFRVAHISMDVYRTLALLKDNNGGYLMHNVEIDGKFYKAIEDVIFFVDQKDEIIYVKEE